MLSAAFVPMGALVFLLALALAFTLNAGLAPAMAANEGVAAVAVAVAAWYCTAVIWRLYGEHEGLSRMV